MDQLADIFIRQYRLMQELGDKERAMGLPVPEPNAYGAIDDPGTQLYLKHLAWCIVEELGEAMNELKNRPWKSSFTITDRVHYQEELVDVLHFFIELCIASGITPDHLHTLYTGKHQENLDRQKRGY